MKKVNVRENNVHFGKKLHSTLHLTATVPFQWQRAVNTQPVKLSKKGVDNIFVFNLNNGFTSLLVC